ncbi:MAG: FAD:protein FMN transferase [Lachnospiraceae bacterium]|nr:FAD:protein FMN transferase [Lachnospiraceae bacterium]
MVKKRLLQILIVLCILAPLVVLAVFWGNNGKTYTKEGYYFDTYVSITVYSAKDLDLLEDCMEMCEKYDEALGRFNYGELTNINQKGYAGVDVSKDTYYLFERALEFCDETNGAVDITIAPLLDLWGFTHDSKGNALADKKPSDLEIRQALKKVNYKKVKLYDGNRVKINESGVQTDLGFIAKGFVADKLKEYLVENNVESAIISLGGNVVVIGSKPDGSDYKIGIKDPNNPEGIIDSISVSDKSVVTSGTYERFVEYDGVKYHHIINTNTGYPVKTDVKSVTIISDSSLEGDALSTICLILGEEKSKDILEKYNAEAIFY